jgi:hypothetical protein
VKEAKFKMSILIFVVSCILALIMLGLVIAGIVMVLQAGRRDTVSAAREDWIQRRSEKDERGW